MITRSLVSCLFIASLVAVGCAPGSSSAESTDILTVWELSEEPAFVLRSDDTRTEAQFGQIRDVQRLAQGSVIATNFSRPPEIRAFSASGEHMWSLGGTGEGPGEFQAISWIKPLSVDTLVAADPWQSRFTTITTSGEVVEVTNITEWGGTGGMANLYPRDLLPDGTLLGQQNRFFPDTTSGTGRGHMPLFRVALSGRVLDSIGVFPTADHAPGTEGFQALPLFARRAAVAGLDGDRFLHGMGDDFSFTAYSLAGEPLQEYSRPWEPRPVTQEMIDALKDAELARVEGPESDQWRAQINRRYADGPRLETLPAYERFLVADDGTIWVQGYHALIDAEIIWSAFDESGPFLGSLSVPAAFRITQFGPDFVAGVWKDDLDIESPRVYELRRLPGEPT